MAPKSSDARNAVRGLATAGTKGKVVVEWRKDAAGAPLPDDQPGTKFELRTPTRAQLDYMDQNLVIGKGKNARPNSVAQSLYLIMQNTYVPETGELVFEAADRETLMQLPIGKDTLLGKLQDGIVALMGVTPEDMEKN